MILPDHFRTPAAYWLSLILILLLALLTSVWLSWQQPQPLQLQDYYRYQCHTPAIAQEDKPVFNILTLGPQNAQAMADNLCADPVFAGHYAGVLIRWRRRDYLTLEAIQDGVYDLFFNRQHIVSGIAPNYPLYYSMFQDSPHYILDWISLNDTPQLSADYFAGKRIGLLSDSRSQSFHIQPLDSLNSAGITLSADQITYFSDMYSLYQALQQGKADLIPSPRSLGSEHSMLSQQPYRLMISDHMSPGSWFLSHRVSPEVYCSLHRILDLYNQRTFADAVPTPDCR